MENIEKNLLQPFWEHIAHHGHQCLRVAIDSGSERRAKGFAPGADSVFYHPVAYNLRQISRKLRNARRSISNLVGHTLWHLHTVYLYKKYPVRLKLVGVNGNKRLNE
jgi:hypothetical protein